MTIERPRTGWPGQRTAFVGRQGELATLLQHLAAAGRGEGHLVLLAGEPGIGKTRLLHELAQRARAAGWQVLLGRADESEGMPPYLPFVEALREHVRTAPLAALRAQLGDEAAEVALLLREVRRRLPELPPSQPLRPEHERYRLLDSVAGFLLAIARSAARRDATAAQAASESSGPLPAAGLLLGLDDLHWAPAPSVLLLQHLARRLDGTPLLVVGTYRSEAVGPGHPLAAMLLRLRREGIAEPLRLAALPLPETATLVAALTGQAAAAPVVAAIHQRPPATPSSSRRSCANCGPRAATWAIPARWRAPGAYPRASGR